MDNLQQEAADKWNTRAIDTGMYLQAKRFLEGLRGGLAVLRQPDAAKYVNGSYAAKGKTIAELARNMSQQGLRFAPALPGSEPAYFGLYNSMLAYAAAGETSSSFRVSR